MARYFFNLANGERERDDLGMDLPDIEAARLEAVRYAGELLRGEPSRLWSLGQWRVEVTDEQDILLCTVITLAIDAPNAERPTERA